MSCGVAWCGVVWCGVVWCGGVGWGGVGWGGVGWGGVGWGGVPQGTASLLGSSGKRDSKALPHCWGAVGGGHFVPPARDPTPFGGNHALQVPQRCGVVGWGGVGWGGVGWGGVGWGAM